MGREKLLVKLRLRRFNLQRGSDLRRPRLPDSQGPGARAGLQPRKLNRVHNTTEGRCAPDPTSVPDSPDRPSIPGHSDR